MNALFSYGTLQTDDVQIATFGRLLSGSSDQLEGWREVRVEITDPDVLRISQARFHPLLVPGPGPVITGTVFDVSEEELIAADAYEVPIYVRQELELVSGRRAWVYVARAPEQALADLQSP